MPDATGLELLAQEIGKHEPDAVLDTVYFRDRATLLIDPAHVKAVMTLLRDGGYRFMSSVHGVDYYPDEPRLGVLYELLDMDSIDRLTVKLRVDTQAPEVDSVMDVFPTANFKEREVYDMFGVVFRGHPDLRRILMPEEFTAYPLRKDYPLRGRGERHNFPVLTRAES